MNSKKPVHVVTIGALLTALAVIFQSAPVFLPVIGLIFSPIATLPIALLSVASTYLGIIALLSSTLILLLINPQEAIIFLLATGPLGLALGSSYFKGMAKSITISGGTLFIGINIITNVMGIAVFGTLTPASAFIAKTFVYIIFSLNIFVYLDTGIKFLR